MWKTKSLKDLCSIFTDGDWIEKKDQSVDGIRLVQTGNIKVGYFAERQDKARYISEDTFNRLNCTEVKRGDILVSRLPDPVGRASIIPELKDKAITAVDCTIIRLKEEILPTYLNYYMQSPQYLSSIQLKVTGATRQRISRKNLGEISITFPPLAEQQRIVAKLDVAFAEIDEAIEGSKKQETEVLKFGYSSITNTLKNLANIYSSKPLNDVVIIQPKKKLALEKISESDDVSFMGMKELGIEQKYTEAINTKPLNEVFKSYQYFEENDVVFAKITPCYENGKLGIMKNLKNGIGFGSSEFVVLRPNSEVYCEYIYYCLLDETFRKNGTKNMSGAVGHKRVTKDYYFNYQIAVPPLSMQIECIKEFDEIWKQAEIISKLKHKKINELISLKSAILKQELQSSEAA